jgi:periplasmic divalent cation tolerance protein
MIHLCLATAPEKSAAELARALVTERLAACVNIVPGVRSIYRWEGAVEESAEVLLLAKTTPEQREALEARLRELHPYECPELLVLDVRSGIEEYLGWVAASTGPEQPDGSSP